MGRGRRVPICNMRRDPACVCWFGLRASGQGRAGMGTCLGPMPQATGTVPKESGRGCSYPIPHYQRRWGLSRNHCAAMSPRGEQMALRSQAARPSQTRCPPPCTGGCLASSSGAGKTAPSQGWGEQALGAPSHTGLPQGEGLVLRASLSPASPSPGRHGHPLTAVSQLASESTWKKAKSSVPVLLVPHPLL